MNLVQKCLNKLNGDDVMSFPHKFFSLFQIKIKRLYITKIKFEHIDQPNKILWVDPNDIRYYQLGSDQTNYNFWENRDSHSVHELEKGSFNKYIYAGAVVPGCWDLYKKQHKFDLVYKWIKGHFELGRDWKNTEFYRNHILFNKIDDPSLSPEQNYNLRKSLYDSIKKHGYKSHSEISEIESTLPNYYKNRMDTDGSVLKEVGVNISRDGEFIFNNDNHHRLAIAKVLNIDEIPVIVVVRHKNWNKIRSNINSAKSLEELSRSERKYIDHPDTNPSFVSSS